MTDLRALKIAHRDQRMAREREARARRRFQRRCFWTRPLGHEWAELQNEYQAVKFYCVACGRERP